MIILLALVYSSTARRCTLEQEDFINVPAYLAHRVRNSACYDQINRPQALTDAPTEISA